MTVGSKVSEFIRCDCAKCELVKVYTSTVGVGVAIECGAFRSPHPPVDWCNQYLPLRWVKNDVRN